MAGDAHDGTDDVVQGFKDAAKQRHVAVDDTWFKQTDDGLSATLAIRVPIPAITAVAAPAGKHD